MAHRQDPFPYAPLCEALSRRSPETAITWLTETLPTIWLEDYAHSVQTNLALFIRLSPFTVLFDQVSALGMPQTDVQEDRVIAVYGCSRPPANARDQSRMKGYLGPSHEAYGAGYDKGHFIAHSAGGEVLDSLGWFPQHRALNRGWSAEGRRYREMERYCAAHPGTFMFSRPIYGSASPKPTHLEFGILHDGCLEIELFEN